MDRADMLFEGGLASEVSSAADDFWATTNFAVAFGPNVGKHEFCYAAFKILAVLVNGLDVNIEVALLGE